MKFTKLNIGDTVATSGTRVFKKLTTEEVTPVVNHTGGLYDADDNLVASWNDLVYVYGMEFETFLGEFDENNPSHPSYILTHNSELSAGTKIVVSDKVTSIGQSAFRDCTTITSIVLHDSVSALWANAFRNCTSLASIVIPDGVGAIGGGAFENCTSLASIVIPTSVKYILPAAFKGCTSLTDVYYRGTEEEWAAVVINSRNECLTNATIHCYIGPINGAYRFNDTITELPIVSADAEELDDQTGVIVDFLDSKLTEGTCIMMSNNKLNYYHFLPIKVYSYDTNSWNYERSRFVTFNNAIAKNYNGEDVTPIFYKWLATNTVKQGQITFTIDGITYTADEGTRWGHWLESTHNTYNFIRSLGGDNVWMGGIFAERKASVSTDGANLVTTTDAIIAGYNYVLVDR